MSALKSWPELQPLVYASLAVVLLAVGLHGNHVFLQCDFFTNQKIDWSTPQGTYSLADSLAELHTQSIVHSLADLHTQSIVY